MGDLAEHIAQRARAAIEGLSKDERADAYVVAFFVYNEDDDHRRPTLTIGTNTETSVSFASSAPPDFVKPHIWWTPTDHAKDLRERIVSLCPPYPHPSGKEPPGPSSPPAGECCT